MDVHIKWNISEEKRAEYAETSRKSQLARKHADENAALLGDIELTAKFRPELLMPKRKRSDIRSLSLFSGGGGLDLGFDLAGFRHVASYELLDFAGETIKKNRQRWKVFSGHGGDVTSVNWNGIYSDIDFLHGGPPCQPFSIAGRRSGNADSRDMFPEFLRAVEQLSPKVFLAENVIGFLSNKFKDYRASLVAQLSDKYHVTLFKLSASDFGVPQDRKRVFLVGVRKSFASPFNADAILKAKKTSTVREALGLPANGVVGYAPTIRCTLSGPRQTTSIANSTASVSKWTELGIWPHGVSPDRKTAASFPTKNGTYRLCVQEAQLLQGFPLSWHFYGPVYQRLGMIGNSVCPPVAYAIATAIRDQLFND